MQTQIPFGDVKSGFTYFEKGDVILSLNGKKAGDAASFMRKILFSKLGTQHRIKVQRNGKVLSLKVLTQLRYGGGFVSDTYLESRGIYFDETLTIIKIKDSFKNYGLLVGDRLIGVNGKRVSSSVALQEHISNYKDFSLLLLERENFQFFVKIN